SVTPRPPVSIPLSPYPTLFRSISHSLRVLNCFYICTPRRISTAYPHLSEGRYPQIQGSQNFTLERLRRYILHLDTNHQRAIRSSDRKSTRLNSSHVKISYAGFC